jgi:hypothetical protein
LGWVLAAAAAAGAAGLCPGAAWLRAGLRAAVAQGRGAARAGALAA